MRSSPVTFLLSFFERLRFPWLFALVGSLFVFDFFVPDLIPFIDEQLLGGGTILLGAWKKRRRELHGDQDQEGTESKGLPPAQEGVKSSVEPSKPESS